MLQQQLSYTNQINLFQDRTSNLVTNPVDLGEVLSKHSFSLTVDDAVTLNLTVIIEWSVDGVHWNKLFVVETGDDYTDGETGDAKDGIPARFIRASINFDFGSGTVNLRYNGGK